MNARPYLFLSGTIFALVSLLHLLRAVLGWEFVIGGWSAPAAVSWLGGAVALGLAVWAFRLAGRAG